LSDHLPEPKDIRDGAGSPRGRTATTQQGLVARQKAALSSGPSINVRIAIEMSRPSDQLRMYSRSCATRLAIESMSGVSPRQPATCASPVMPGLASHLAV